jgi:hypothetical protein
MTINLAHLIPVAAIVYLAIGFRFCKFWMKRSITHPERCGWSNHDGCDMNLWAAVLSVPLWPLHAPILLSWVLGWGIWKPFNAAWKQTKEQVAAERARKESMTKHCEKMDRERAAILDGHISKTSVKDMTEWEYDHWMKCAACRGVELP